MSVQAPSKMSQRPFKPADKNLADLLSEAAYSRLMEHGAFKYLQRLSGELRQRHPAALCAAEDAVRRTS